MSERCPTTKEEHLCAFHENKSGCWGDSGGPLTVSGGQYMRYVGLLKFFGRFVIIEISTVVDLKVIFGFFW